MSRGHRLRIRARGLAIPFVCRFSHAATRRDASHTLWVDIRDELGNSGYGEGCPREYVTAESIIGGLSFIATHSPEWQLSITDVGSLKAWVANNRTLIDRHPAAWCAVELAFLDLFGKQAGCSVESLLDLQPLSGEFSYTAVLGDGSSERFAELLARYQALGMRDYKIKLSGDRGADLAKVIALDRAGLDPARVRADANNLWHRATDAGVYLKSLCYPFAAIEEPLRPGDIGGQSRIAMATGARIVLDESLLRLGQLEDYFKADFAWLANVRVSKLGGLLRTLEVARCAAQGCAGIIVGAHIGETSLLTRAGLTVAQAMRAQLYGQEGAFGEYLLSHDVVDRPLQFGQGGLVRACTVPAGTGFGVAVSQARLSA